MFPSGNGALLIDESDLVDVLQGEELQIPDDVAAYQRREPFVEGWSGDWRGNFNNREFNNYPQ